MILRLERDPQPTFTPGELFVDDIWCAVTLEDVVRPPGVKVPGQTAIPYGSYEVIINESARFKCRMPLLVAVPMFTGVRIHSGNTTEETDGCILVGSDMDGNRITGSRVAFNNLFAKLNHAFELGEPITIDIVRMT